MTLATGETARIDIGLGGLEVPLHQHDAARYPNGHAGNTSLAIVPYAITRQPDAMGDRGLDIETTNEALKTLYGLGYAVKFSGTYEVCSELKWAAIETRPHISRRHRRQLSRQLGIGLTGLVENTQLPQQMH